MKQLNAFEVLGVEEGASFVEIRKAFRQRVREFHPDLNPNENVEIFLALRKAYQILLDPVRNQREGLNAIFPLQLLAYFRPWHLQTIKTKARMVETWA